MNNQKKKIERLLAYAQTPANYTYVDILPCKVVPTLPGGLIFSIGIYHTLLPSARTADARHAKQGDLQISALYSRTSE